MLLPTQTKILRAIQEGEIQRVGATKVKKIDVRLIAATHKNLEEMVRNKSFREDLYYRLNVVRIETPPLRERMEDLPELVDFMLQRLNKKQSTGTTEISREAMSVLEKYNWPGNVRELENALHSSSVVSKGKRILGKDLPSTLTELIEAEESGKQLELPPALPNLKPLAQQPESVIENIPGNPAEPASPAFGNHPTNENDTSLPSAPSSISSEESYDIAYAHARETSQTNLLEVVEKEMIRRSLKESGGNQVKASAMLGITRATLRKRIDAYEIRY
jgi:two-component system nitrogen regulation response regulator GlnG